MDLSLAEPLPGLHPVMCCARIRSLVFQREAGFEHDLIVPDIAVLNVAAGWTSSNQCRCLDVWPGRLIAVWMASSILVSDDNQFHHLADMIRHRVLLL